MELGLLTIVVLRPLGLEEAYGKFAGQLIGFSLLWLIGFCWLLLPVRLAASLFRRLS